MHSSTRRPTKPNLFQSSLSVCTQVFFSEIRTIDCKAFFAVTGAMLGDCNFFLKISQISQNRFGRSLLRQCDFRGRLQIACYAAAQITFRVPCLPSMGTSAQKHTKLESGISQNLGNFQISQNLGNFPKFGKLSKFGKFSKIWEISQTLGNSQI